MLRVVFFAALMICTTLAHALVRPTPSKSDPHFQRTKYTTEIIEIRARIGKVLEIQLSPKETDIQYMIGDRDAWTIKTAGNLFTMKPKAASADTNLKLWSKNHTRVYWFRLVMVTDAKAPELWSLTFDYPPGPPPPPPSISPAVLAVQLAAQQKEAVETNLGRHTYEPPQAAEQTDRPINGMYGIIGPEELTPTSVYDNGELTAITFAPNNPMPTVFAKEADGSESRVNYHIENDMMIVHRVARKFVLRRGSAVACLINGNFQPTGQNSRTHTASDFVRREVKRTD
jgi:type IV secretion system protein VirB9